MACFSGQPVFIDLLTVGHVLLLLETASNKYNWKAKDANGKEQKMN